MTSLQFFLGDNLMRKIILIAVLDRNDTSTIVKPGSHASHEGDIHFFHVTQETIYSVFHTELLGPGSLKSTRRPGRKSLSGKTARTARTRQFPDIHSGTTRQITFPYHDAGTEP